MDFIPPWHALCIRFTALSHLLPSLFKEDNMKRILQSTLIALTSLSSSAFAAEATGTGEGSLLVAMFIGFFALIIVFQLVPATLMLIGILRGLFGRDQKRAKVSR